MSFIRIALLSLAVAGCSMLAGCFHLRQGGNPEAVTGQYFGYRGFSPRPLPVMESSTTIRPERRL